MLDHEHLHAQWETGDQDLSDSVLRSPSLDVEMGMDEARNELSMVWTDAERLIEVVRIGM